MMYPGRDPACSPRPPLTSLAWIPLPGPELAAFSVSIQCECVFLSEPCFVIMQFYLQEESDSFQFYVPILALHSVCLCA